MESNESTYHVMTKPRGAVCNLDCSYCYYLDKTRLYPGADEFRMSEETLEEYVRQYLQQPAPVVTFTWQGGEPTLMGKEFFERAVELQQQYKPEGTRVENTLQTNGTLLDEEWAAFFGEHDFLVGLSLDGPKPLHDYYRADKGGEGSWNRVVRGLGYLKEYEVEHNVLCCVNAHNAEHPYEIYECFQDLDLQFWQFIPVVEQKPGTAEQTTDRSVGPEQYGDFLTQIFNRWVRNDVASVSVRLFDVCLRTYLGMDPGLCVFEETCGDALALEHNGDLYSCDHFVDPDHLLGNIHERPMNELRTRPRQQQFGTDKKQRLPSCCRDCSVQFLCNGGCPKNRFVTAPDGEDGLNYLCAGYFNFFRYVDPYMRLMAREYAQGRPPENIMSLVRRNPKPFKPDDLGRNDLCYCGSGKKYKYCCL